MLGGGERGCELEDRVLDRAVAGSQALDRIVRHVAEPGTDLEHAHAALGHEVARDELIDQRLAVGLAVQRGVRDAQEVRERGLLMIELLVGVR